MNNNLNAWSTYFDFIDIFKDLKYRDIPLALLCHFPTYINEYIFIKKGKIPPAKNFNREDIQKRFNNLFGTNLNSLYMNQPNKNSKILLYDNNLRFTEKNYLRYFNKSNTVILRNLDDIRPPIKNVPKTLPIPIHILNDYAIKTDHLIKPLQQQAKHLFKYISIHHAFKNHPIFNDESFQKRFIENEIPQSISFIEAIYNFFKKTPIACAILGDAASFDKPSRIIPLVAKLQGIPSITIQNAIIGADRGWLPIISTKHMAYGHYEIEYFKKAGATDSQLEIMGHPRFDEVFLNKHMDRNNFYSKFKLDRSKKSVLICTQPKYITKASEVEILARVLSTDPCYLLIKPHPHETYAQKKYQPIINKYPNVRLLSTEETLYDIISNIDASIVWFSTTGLESLLFNKPVVYLNESQWGGAPYKYCDELIQKNPENAAKIIRKILFDPSFNMYVSDKIKKHLSIAYPKRDAGKELCKIINKLTRKDFFPQFNYEFEWN